MSPSQGPASCQHGTFRAQRAGSFNFVQLTCQSRRLCQSYARRSPVAVLGNIGSFQLRCWCYSPPMSLLSLSLSPSMLRPRHLLHDRKRAKPVYRDPQSRVACVWCLAITDTDYLAPTLVHHRLGFRFWFNMRFLFNSNMVIMLLVLLQLLGTDLIASATPTPEVAITAAASPSQCSSGQRGGLYWCYGAHFDNLGSAKGCSWEPPMDTCWYFMYPKDVRRSIGPDAGTVCRCMFLS
jgi:hypothetical protein